MHCWQQFVTHGRKFLRDWSEKRGKFPLKVVRKGSEFWRNQSESSCRDLALHFIDRNGHLPLIIMQFSGLSWTEYYLEVDEISNCGSFFCSNDLIIFLCSGYPTRTPTTTRPPAPGRGTGRRLLKPMGRPTIQTIPVLTFRVSSLRGTRTSSV